MSLRRDSAKSRAFAERGRESSARSLEASRRRAARRSAERRARKPALPFNPYDATCELARFDRDQAPCRGLIQRCHLIPNQLLRDWGFNDVERWHPDFWLQGCEHHHNRQHKGFVKIPRASVPAGLELRAKRDRKIEGYLDLHLGSVPRIGAAA